MNSSTRSLRQRLFLLILLPLILMSTVLGYWRYTAAVQTADELFDRSLLAVALVISRDVAISDGDIMTPNIRDLIRDAAGEQVFYHVTGPAGSYVTGYASPPVAPAMFNFELRKPGYFESTYRGEEVHVVSLTEHGDTGFLTGDTTVTVWQRASARRDFARRLGFRAAALMGALLTTLAIVVWFGVQTGLRPLLDLENAIATRSPNDLSPIKRAIPAEAHGIVATLNRLFEQVAKSLTAHQSFISDASHQLRNPAAAVLSMAEAVRDAGSDEAREQRLNQLVMEARASSRVTDQLLSLDRLRQGSWSVKRELFDLNALSKAVCAEAAVPILSQGIDFTFCAGDQELKLNADKVFVSEAIKNLIDNALKHGGASLSSIKVKTAQVGGLACVTVEDDGIGLSPTDQETAFSRFGQVEPSSGSGLGLAIVHSVAEEHGGSLNINAKEQGASISFCLPLRDGEFS